MGNNPGPIDHSRLRTKEGDLRPDLRLKYDYISVNSSVWSLFRYIHGCSSSALCYKNNIYDDGMSEPDDLSEPEELKKPDAYKLSWLFVDACKADEDLYHEMIEEHSPDGTAETLIRLGHIPEKEKGRKSSKTKNNIPPAIDASSRPHKIPISPPKK